MLALANNAICFKQLEVNFAIIYRTRVSSLFTLVTNRLTDSLSD